ncbi:phage/plasmid primase, P4 family [Paracoccus sp. MBLB3053]|uniref:Phage/plasmid primase, P4 family n=1 Tax=Paracoccus aurantius TaxID=3073814 RepID=A0ABU2HV92_9RHOB|nr:phage/plasmid primase, P4 family [Paracoccus sp. MBLB3053]MDS9468199.1 phage/plasmid primase, P4 family [Paracoccus sp. MBLB3053]
MKDHHETALGEVRSVMGNAEEVDLPDDMAKEFALEEGGEHSPGTPSDDPIDDPLVECAQYQLNDHGNGQRYARHYRDELIHVPRYGWHLWTGQRWQKDEDGIEVRRRAQKIGGLISQEVPHLRLEDWQMQVLEEGVGLRRRERELSRILSGNGDDAEAAQQELDSMAPKLARLAGIEKVLLSVRKDHHGWAKTSGNTTRIDALIKEAGIDLAVPFERLNSAPLDVCCENGVLRFSVSPGDPVNGMSAMGDMQFVSHSRDQLITKMMPVPYDPAATCPTFFKFISRVLPDPDVRRFVQRWFALNTTALTGDQKLVFFYGLGANGKSVLVDLIARMFGDYAATARIETLTGSTKKDGSAATPDLVPLMLARMVRTSEPEEGEKLREGLIKQLTGGEPINVRPNFGEQIEVTPKFKITIQGNYRPEVRGRDDGIWRRLLIVPFDVTIPPKERDPDLGAKLWEERSGILNWLIEGLIDYLEGGLQEPQAVLSATNEYREESDPIGFFLESCCDVSGQPEDSETAKDLAQAFQFWQDEQGGNVWQQGTVQRQLKDKMRRWVSPKTGRQFSERKSNGIMRYDGIRLLIDFGHRFRTAPRDAKGRPIAGRTGAQDESR